VGAIPAAPGLSIFFLGPVAVAAVRLGREGATAAAALAALVLLLPALLRGGEPGPVPAAIGLGAVLLLSAGLVAGELVRLADRRRQTEQAAAQAAQQNTREVQMILDNLGSGLLTVDAAGLVTRVNPQARVLLGLQGGDCTRRPLSGVLADGGAALANQMLKALADGRPRKRCEVKVQRQGSEVPLGLSVDILTGEDGALAGAVAIFTDLTEVQRLQSQLRRSDRLAGVGELAASIAHELRNPLASIRGSVELLSSDLEVEGHHAQLLQLILRESGRLNTIITDFLAFARMRQPQPREVDLDDFLAQVLLQLRQHIAAEGGQVTVSVASEVPELHLWADPEQLVQAILNLGLNACEAMHYDGELRLEVGLHGDLCELRLHDTGPGLDPARSEDIFTPFVTTKPQGTGLGLPMVARIVHGHGGSVEAGNNPAGGAEFILRLPLNVHHAAGNGAGEPAAEEMQLAVY
jgi:two-component system, NtrC family, sensor histidine kinase PilS